MRPETTSSLAIQDALEYRRRCVGLIGDAVPGGPVARALLDVVDSLDRLVGCLAHGCDRRFEEVGGMQGPCSAAYGTSCSRWDSGSPCRRVPAAPGAAAARQGRTPPSPDLPAQPD